MRIAQIVNGLLPGGAERVMADLAVGLKERGHESMVISLMPVSDDSPSWQALREQSVPVTILHLKKHAPWRLFALRRVLKSFRPDIVHAHLFHAHIASRIWGRGYTVINTYHGTEKRRHRFWQNAVDGWTQHLVDGHTAVSPAVRRLRPGGEAFQDRVEVIPNGIRPPDLVSPEERDRLRESWGVTGCHRVVGSAGRLVWQKGYDILLDLLPEISREIPANEVWGIVLLGEGPMRGRLEKAARNTPPNIRVCLPGFSPRAATEVGAFDVFVLPSRSEGFGLAAAEAMAHGLPTVGARVGGLPDLLASYPNGRLLDFKGSPEKVAQELAAVIKMKSPRTPRAPVTLEDMVDSYLDYYRALRRERGR